MKIDVSRNACVGAGTCALVAENLFDQDDDGLVVVLVEAPVPGDHQAARKAASLCPARAIQLYE
jgi:ferredoxin